MKTPVAGEFPKRCTKCGVAITAAEWAQLPDPKTWDVPADPTDAEEPEAYSLEMRNHTCGTTLAVKVA